MSSPMRFLSSGESPFSQSRTGSPPIQFRADLGEQVTSVPMYQWRSLTSVRHALRCYIARSPFFLRLYE